MKRTYEPTNRTNVTLHHRGRFLWYVLSHIAHHTYILELLIIIYYCETRYYKVPPILLLLLLLLLYIDNKQTHQDVEQNRITT